MKKFVYLSIYLSIYLSVSLNGQVINSQEKAENAGIKRNASYNLEEIKVRWKKSALENCPGVPCVVTPPAPSFTCGTSTISDYDGNVYNTVSIGNQCWTKTNLKVTKYNDGSVIPDVTNSASWAVLNTGARSDNTGFVSYIATYGYLYNWYAATDSRKICPAGWHLPTDEEWTSLIQFIDPVASSAVGIQSITAGSKLKSTSNLWNVGSPGTDYYSYNALPGGFRLTSGNFVYEGVAAFFWSATETVSLSSHAVIRALDYNHGNVNKNNEEKKFGGTVRCLKD